MSILKLNPTCKDYIWGGDRLKKDFKIKSNYDKIAESWELSCHPAGLSKIENKEFYGMTLKEYIDRNGNNVLGSNCKKFHEFPVLIKLIDAKDNLSIQVHPDDSYALKKEGEYGKTEMWYIVDCEESAFIYYGLKKEISKKELKDRVENNTLLEVLNKVRVKKGDTFFIEAGTIHAIGAGILIAEIQQNSNVTYRVYDYNRKDKYGNKRELHVDKAIEVSDIKPVDNKLNGFPHIAKCKYFSVDKIYLDGSTMDKLYGKSSEETFLNVLILDGKGEISSEKDNFSYKKGDSFFIPAKKGYYSIEGSCQALITSIPK